MLHKIQVPCSKVFGKFNLLLVGSSIQDSSIQEHSEAYEKSYRNLVYNNNYYYCLKSRDSGKFAHRAYISCIAC